MFTLTERLEIVKGKLKNALLHYESIFQMPGARFFDELKALILGSVNDGFEYRLEAHFSQEKPGQFTFKIELDAELTINISAAIAYQNEKNKIVRAMLALQKEQDSLFELRRRTCSADFDPTVFETYLDSEAEKIPQVQFSCSTP